ncbi:hypothetical protein BGZ99_010416 [Dissophora globulifera]|uniref:G domain-containing protein n=1 Tax=Dissophora globulifera TaxID=979702 RepID=A0A9P6UM49_9FUNG|nr:hypothetical protein BGZ99_010416 [Dissophora globulifera]
MTRSKDTKIILVMGVTGAGKSYMIREISGQDIKVGHGQRSCTQEIDPVSCQIGDQSVIILDTPGFDDSTRTDTEVLTDVAEYLTEIYQQNYRICGIIYLHNIEETKYRGSAFRNLAMFGRLCGENAYGNVVMLTRGWSSISALSREIELTDDIWKPYLDKGCKIDRYRDKDDLIRIFNTLIQKKLVGLKIQEEMVEEEMPLDRTAAGSFVWQGLTRKKEKFEEELAAIAENYHMQTKQMQAGMDKSRLQLEAAIKKLEVEKLLLTNSQARAEEASKAGMQEQYRQLEHEREDERKDYEQRLKRAETEKDEAIREKIKLELLLRHHRDQQNLRKKEGRFWDDIAAAIISALTFNFKDQRLLQKLYENLIESTHSRQSCREILKKQYQSFLKLNFDDYWDDRLLELKRRKTRSHCAIVATRTSRLAAQNASLSESSLGFRSYQGQQHEEITFAPFNDYYEDAINSPFDQNNFQDFLATVGTLFISKEPTSMQRRHFGMDFEKLSEAMARMILPEEDDEQAVADVFRKAERQGVSEYARNQLKKRIEEEESSPLEKSTDV